MTQRLKTHRFPQNRNIPTSLHHIYKLKPHVTSLQKQTLLTRPTPSTGNTLIIDASLPIHISRSKLPPRRPPEDTHRRAMSEPESTEYDADSESEPSERSADPKRRTSLGPSSEQPSAVVHQPAIQNQEHPASSESQERAASRRHMSPVVGAPVSGCDRGTTRAASAPEADVKMIAQRGRSAGTECLGRGVLGDGASTLEPLSRKRAAFSSLESLVPPKRPKVRAFFHPPFHAWKV